MRLLALLLLVLFALPALSDEVGSDLGRDARQLVKDGGRFEASSPFRAFLGAQIVVRGELVGYLRGVRKGSLAGAMGLQDGDRVLELDGLLPAPGFLGRWADANRLEGQRTLRVRRRDGRVEHWTLTPHRS